MKIALCLVLCVVAVSTAAASSDEYDYDTDVIPTLYGSSGTAVTLTGLSSATARVVVSIMDADNACKVVLSAITNILQFKVSATLPSSSDNSGWTTAASAQSSYWYATSSSIADGQIRWFHLVQASADASAYNLVNSRVTSITVAAAATSAALSGLVDQGSFHILKITGASPVFFLTTAAGTSTGTTFGCAVNANPSTAATSYSPPHYVTAASTTIADGSGTWYCPFKRVTSDNSGLQLVATAVASITVADAGTSAAFVGLTANTAMTVLKITGSNIISKVVYSNTITGLTYGCAVGMTPTSQTTATATSVWIMATGSTLADGSVTWWCTHVQTSTSNAAVTVVPTKIASLTVASATPIQTTFLSGISVANGFQLVKVSSANIVMRFEVSAGTSTGISYNCAALKAPTAAATSYSAAVWIVGNASENDGSITWWCMYTASASVSTTKLMFLKVDGYAVTAGAASGALTQLDNQGAYVMLRVNSANQVMKLTSSGTITGLSYVCQVAATIVAKTNEAVTVATFTSPTYTYSLSTSALFHSVAEGSVSWFCAFTRTSAVQMQLIAVTITTANVAAITTSGGATSLTDASSAQLIKISSLNSVITYTASGTGTGNYGCHISMMPLAVATAVATTKNYAFSTATFAASTVDGSTTWFCVQLLTAASTATFTLASVSTLTAVSGTATTASASFFALSVPAAQLIKVASSTNVLSYKMAAVLGQVQLQTAGDGACVINKAPTGTLATSNVATTVPIFYAGFSDSTADSSITWWCYTSYSAAATSFTFTMTSVSTLTATIGTATTANAGFFALTNGVTTYLQLIKAASANNVVSYTGAATTAGVSLLSATGCVINKAPAATAATTGQQSTTALYFAGFDDSTADGSATWWCYQSYSKAATSYTFTIANLSTLTATVGTATTASASFFALTTAAQVQLIKAGSANNVMSYTGAAVTAGITLLSTTGCVLNKAPLATVATTTQQSTATVFYAGFSESTADGAATWWCYQSYSKAATSYTFTITNISTITAVVGTASTAAATTFAGTVNPSIQLTKSSSANNVITFLSTGTTTNIGLTTCRLSRAPSSTSATTSASATAVYFQAFSDSTADGSLTWWCYTSYSNAGTSATVTITNIGTVAFTAISVTHSTPLTDLNASGAMVLVQYTSANNFYTLRRTSSMAITGMTYSCTAGKTGTSTPAGTLSYPQFNMNSGGSATDGSITWFCVFMSSSTNLQDLKVTMENDVSLSVATGATSAALTELDQQGSMQSLQLTSTGVATRISYATGTSTSVTYTCTAKSIPTVATTTTITSSSSTWVASTADSSADGSVTYWCAVVRGSTDVTTLQMSHSQVTTVSVSATGTSTALVGLLANTAVNPLRLTASNLAAFFFSPAGTSTGMTFGCSMSSTPSVYSTAFSSTNYLYGGSASAADAGVTWVCLFAQVSTTNSAVTITHNVTQTINAVVGTASFAFTGLSAAAAYQIVKITAASTTNLLVFRATVIAGVTYQCEDSITPSAATGNTLSSTYATYWESRSVIARTTATLFCAFTTTASADMTLTATVGTMLQDVATALPSYVNFYPYALVADTTATVSVQLMWQTGTFYYQASTNPTTPSKTQVKGMTDITGAALTIGGRAGSVFITAANSTFTASLSNLNITTVFYFHHYAVDSFANEATEVSTFQFTTVKATSSGGVQSTVMTTAVAAGSSSISVACGSSCATIGWYVGATACIGFATSSTYECRTVSSLASIAFTTALTYAHSTNEPVSAGTSGTSASSVVIPSLLGLLVLVALALLY